MEFLETAYGRVTLIAGVFATLWGLSKALGALRRWLVKWYTEHKERREMPQKTLQMLQDMRQELNAKDADMGDHLQCIDKKIDDIINNQNFSADQIATMQNEKLIWAYMHYGVQKRPIPLQTKLSLERMYAQYRDAGKRNHVPADWLEVMSATPIEGTETRE